MGEFMQNANESVSANLAARVEESRRRTAATGLPLNGIAMSEYVNPDVVAERAAKSGDASSTSANLAARVEESRRRTAATGLPQNGIAMSEYVNPDVVAERAAKAKGGRA